ncbi:MAG: LuxR C-terminal-related transcriptional regulator [Acidimicrobiales bacterium]
MAGPVASAAEAFAEQRWGDAYRLLCEVGRDSLTPADLDRLGVTAYLVGNDDAAVEAWEAAHDAHLDSGDRAEAARCAFWAAFCRMMQGQMAQAGGWLSRCESAMGDHRECAAAGFLLLPALLQAIDADDAARARELASQAREIAERFDDRDLDAFAVLGHGQALLASGDEAAGVAMFDDVMLSVTAGEVGPIVSGVVYCAVILECMQIFDLARATEWTGALDTWCASQPDLVPYRGQCLVHQSQLQQASGDWSEAASTVIAACDRLSNPPHPALGLACYQEGELLRLRGELDAATEAYTRASRAGYEPMPGLALVQLARGDNAAAKAAIRRAVLEAVQPFRRPPLLAAAVEIFAEADDCSAATAAAVELTEIAGSTSSEMLGALAEQAMGTALLAGGEPIAALEHLRRAIHTWQRLHMPYERARVAVLVGQACRALGDETSAALHFDNARETFDSLGARPDRERLLTLTSDGARAETGGLSARELEVLRLVADGKTSPEIAEQLTISRHTVRRHLENIYAKLGVNSRAAATAHAYENHLL